MSDRAFARPHSSTRAPTTAAVETPSLDNTAASVTTALRPLLPPPSPSSLPQPSQTPPARPRLVSAAVLPVATFWNLLADARVDNTHTHTPMRPSADPVADHVREPDVDRGRADHDSSSPSLAQTSAAAALLAATGAFALGIVAGRRQRAANQRRRQMADASDSHQSHLHRQHASQANTLTPITRGVGGGLAESIVFSHSDALHETENSTPTDLSSMEYEQTSTAPLSRRGRPDRVQSQPHPRTSSRPSSTRSSMSAISLDEFAGTGALDCPVCLGELLLPRVLPCGHSLCTSCLVTLYVHERRPACPVCRKRIKVPVERLPVNFAVKTLVDMRVAERGPEAWDEYCSAEVEARSELAPCIDDTDSRNRHVVVEGPANDIGRSDPPNRSSGSGRRGGGGGRRNRSLLAQLRPAWNWFKWSVIIVTEMGAFLVSLKEVLEATPSHTRRYQRIV